MKIHAQNLWFSDGIIRWCIVPNQDKASGNSRVSTGVISRTSCAAINLAAKARRWLAARNVTPPDRKPTLDAWIKGVLGEV